MDLMLLFRNCMTLLSILGIFTELFFLFLLYITRKDRTVQSHAAFLAPNCIFDLIFLLSWAPFRVDILVENGYFIIGITIFNYEISPYLVKAIILILSFSCNLALSVLAIPFYLRFMMICKKQRISLIGKALLYLIPFILNLIVSIFLYYAYQINPKSLEHLQITETNMKGEYWNFAAAYVHNIFFTGACFIVCFELLINYILIIYFNYQVLQCLKREQMLPSELKAYKTLQKAMIIQCSVQSATLLIPFNAFVIGAYLNYTYIFALFVIFNAAPLLTTFCTIFSISEYRKKFIQWYNGIIDLIMLN